MDIILRPATGTDIAFARDAHHQAYHDVVVAQFGSWDKAKQDKFFMADWKVPGIEIILFHGVECGYLRVVRTTTEIQAIELVLLPKFQGQGVGTFLLKKLIDEGRQRQMPVTLRVFHKNRAIALYKRMGFAESERTATHVIMKWQPQ